MRTQKSRVLAYEVVPLLGVQDGLRSLSLRDPSVDNGGPRFHFSQLQFRVRSEDAPTPDRFVPLASLLRHLGLDDYLQYFEPRHRDDLSALLRLSEPELMSHLTSAVRKGGVGMTTVEAERFTVSLPSWAGRLQTEAQSVGGVDEFGDPVGFCRSQSFTRSPQIRRSDSARSARALSVSNAKEEGREGTGLAQPCQRNVICA